ncbi:MAG: methionine--tRNA ligase [Clostridiales bacterium]|nr:methionine--tRNA ligase [Clostridiales bacterium]
MEKKNYYITTPIYYASGKLTVGHCFSTILADICARYYRLDGHKVFYATGSDEHGLKIARVAEQNNMTPQQFVDKTVDEFKFIWEKLGITYDKFIRTTDKHHVELVEKVYQKLYEKGDIYLSQYEGLYCVPCETFFTESQLVEGKCPDCGRPVELTKEESYFLKLSKYQEFLDEYFKEHSDFLVPESRKNEIYNNFIKPGITDLCVSRTTFDWGVRLPFNDKHVAYVWIDALLNYLSVLGYDTKDDKDYKEFWPCNVHVVGRDISRFHCIIWPILLKMLDLPLPTQIHSHGFITLKGDKISKSKSNGFNPLTLVDRYGADALRYYLAKEGPIFNDTPYTAEQFVNTVNSDLCNDLGNLVSRTLAMITQYNGAIIPEPKVNEDSEKMLETACNELYGKVSTLMAEQKINDAVNEIFSVIRLANKYIDMTEPWKLAKDTSKKDKLDTVLYYLSETIRICNTLLQAFLFETPKKVFDKFSYTKDAQTFESIKKFSLTNYGNTVNKGDNLFPRLDVKKEIEFLDTPNAEPKKEEKKPEPKKENKEPAKTEETSEYISFDDFMKVKLITGKVINCEKVPNADKLLKSTVDTGKETRTIVSGIAEYYKPEDLIGKNVIVVANLAPRKLRGIESYGMLLCAENEATKGISLLTTDSDVPGGSEVC